MTDNYSDGMGAAAYITVVVLAVIICFAIWALDVALKAGG